jgi:hypothetical protein
MRYWNTEREKMLNQLSVWEKAMSWRKRQMVQANLDPDYNYEREMRNRTLEEVAKAVHGFKAFEKDTMDSFAAYIRGLKR